MGLGEVLHPVESNCIHAFHSPASSLLAEKKLVHNKKNQLSTQANNTFRMGGQAVQLPIKLIDLAVTDQKKPHDQS